MKDRTGAASRRLDVPRTREPDELPVATAEDRAGEVESPLAVAAAGALAQREGPLRGTVYLLLDRSASMSDSDKLGQLKRGALRFFAEAWQRGFAIGAIAFGDRAACIASAGRDFYLFQRQVLGLQAHGRTAMSLAVRQARRRLRWRRGEKVVVLITDGVPNSREATLFEVRQARDSGIEIIAVGTDGADETFLRALTPRPELASRVAREDLEEGISAAAKALGSGS